MTRGLAANKRAFAVVGSSRIDELPSVLVAVEKRGPGFRRARMSVTSRLQGQHDNTVPYSERRTWFHDLTDRLKSFAGLADVGFKHVARNQPLRSELRKGVHSQFRPSCRSGHWQPPAVADRYLPRSQQGSTPGLPRRVRLSAQPSQDTRSGIFRPSLGWGPLANQQSTSRFAS